MNLGIAEEVEGFYLRGCPGRKLLKGQGEVEIEGGGFGVQGCWERLEECHAGCGCAALCTSPQSRAWASLGTPPTNCAQSRVKVGCREAHRRH